MESEAYPPKSEVKEWLSHVEGTGSDKGAIV